MPTLHLLCGLPGSGKTTAARRLAAGTGAVVLNHDELMIARHGVNPPATEFAAFAAGVTEALWQRAAVEFSAGRDVIFDWGFWTRAQRDEARARGAALGVACQLYWADCSDEVAKARTLARTREARAGALLINAEAWDVFRARFEPPLADEAAVKLPANE